MKNSYFLVYALFCLTFIPSLKANPFMWGVGNSSFQVEGSPEDSDWYQFTHSKGMIEDGTNADVATDFWNRYPEDFALAKKLGANTFRISLAWERIEPKKNEWNEAALDKYEAMILKMRENGLEPVVTLHHFVNPAWVAEKGGLLSPTFATDFTSYAIKAMTRLSKAPANVKWWMTFNEPEILVFCGYFWSCWPPKIYHDPVKAQNAFLALAKAHLLTVREIEAKKLNPVKVSIAKHWAVIMPKTSSKKDVEAAKMYDDFFNRQFMNALLTGKLYFHMPGAQAIEESVEMPPSRPGLDYVGLNYYQRSIVNFQEKYPYYNSVTGPGEKNELGWEMYAEGMYKALKEVSVYKLPILVSENGVADKNDKWRSKFLESHLENLAKAKKEGVDVIGYLHWSLTDNFEWASGLKPRFGLVEIDYTTLKRTPRPSFFTYQKLIESYKNEFSF